MAIRFSKHFSNPGGAELVVVFPAETQRINSGIKIVKDNLPAHFMVIGITAEKLQKLLTKNGVAQTVIALPGGKSRSTFEDVYQTTKTIQAHHFNSVTLVTSDYHLPRAIFLLKLYLHISGQDVRIHGFPVKDAKKLSIKLQQHINETIKFWGSIAELTGCSFTGKLVLDAPNAKKIQMFLKTNLLY
jgi:uncharacterized SAM-binding protein YcdF (DUF218 family)